MRGGVAHVQVGGVQVDVGELDVAEKTCAERADDLVEERVKLFV
jgi:hypothetical protein